MAAGAGRTRPGAAAGGAGAGESTARRSRVDIHTGRPIAAISTAVAKAPACGRPMRHGAGLAALGRAAPARASGAPSKRRIATAIAASRAAGRGGGGSGSDAARSLSTAIHRSPRAKWTTRRPARGRELWAGRSPKHGDEIDMFRPYSLNCGLVECAIGRSGKARRNRRRTPLTYRSSRASAPADLAARTSWTNSER